MRNAALGPNCRVLTLTFELSIHRLCLLSQAFRQSLIHMPAHLPHITHPIPHYFPARRPLTSLLPLYITVLLRGPIFAAKVYLTKATSARIFDNSCHFLTKMAVTMCLYAERREGQLTHPSMNSPRHFLLLICERPSPPMNFGLSFLKCGCGFAPSDFQNTMVCSCLPASSNCSALKGWTCVLDVSVQPRTLPKLLHADSI